MSAKKFNVLAAVADLQRRIDGGQNYQNAHDAVWYGFALTQEEAAQVTSNYIRFTMVKGDASDADIMSTIEENNERISDPCTLASHHESRRYLMIRRACINLRRFVIRHIPSDNICDPIHIDKRTCVGYADRDQAMDYIRNMIRPEYWENYAVLPCPTDWRVTELGDAYMYVDREATHSELLRRHES